jgi:hypothetical protein
LMCEKRVWLNKEVWKDWLLLKEKRYNLIRKSISNKLAKEKIMMLSMKKMGNEEKNEKEWIWLLKWMKWEMMDKWVMVLINIKTNKAKKWRLSKYNMISIQKKCKR